MKRLNWQVFLGIVLIVLSAFVYFLHYLLFRDIHHIFIYLVGDIAFVFIEVLLVTLIIHKLLGEREKRSLLEKMNMVIGTFFSEVGTFLLNSFSTFDTRCEEIKKELVDTKNFTNNQFLQIGVRIKKHECSIKTGEEDLVDLKTFLVGKREFLLRLLANPNLLEHDSFTNLLWAVFHLTRMHYRKLADFRR